MAIMSYADKPCDGGSAFWPTDNSPNLSPAAELERLYSGHIHHLRRAKALWDAIDPAHADHKLNFHRFGRTAGICCSALSVQHQDDCNATHKCSQAHDAYSGRPCGRPQTDASAPPAEASGGTPLVRRSTFLFESDMWLGGGIVALRRSVLRTTTDQADARNAARRRGRAARRSQAGEARRRDSPAPRVPERRLAHSQQAGLRARRDSRGSRRSRGL